MIRYTKDDFALMARKRIHAFMEISRTLGKDHPICQLMGPLGWGRHNMEQGPDTSLQGTIEEKAQSGRLLPHPLHLGRAARPEGATRDARPVPDPLRIRE